MSDTLKTANIRQRCSYAELHHTSMHFQTTFWICEGWS